jgi:hypothetical protein
MIKRSNFDQIKNEKNSDMMLLYYKLEHLSCHRSGSLLDCFDLIDTHKTYISQAISRPTQNYWANLVILLMGDIRLQIRKVESFELCSPAEKIRLAFITSN